MLALSEAEFAEIAKNAGAKPEDLRGMLERNVAREEQRQQASQAMQKPNEVPEESTQQIRAAVLTALRDMASLDIPRDKAREDVLREEADALIRQADQGVESRTIRGGALAGLRTRALHKYKNAYLMEGARMIDEYMAQGFTRADVYRKVTHYLDEKRRRTNLREEESGIWDAYHVFNARANNEPLVKEMEELVQAIESGSAKEEQRTLFRRLISAAKGTLFRGGVSRDIVQAHHVEQYWNLLPFLAVAIRSSGVYKKEAHGVAGPTEAYQLGTIGGRGSYRRNPRPRRSTGDFPEERS